MKLNLFECLYIPIELKFIFRKAVFITALLLVLISAIMLVKLIGGN